MPTSGISLVFFGSGPVGLASLQHLMKHFDIEAVITKPNPASSRAPRLVAEFAEANNLPLYQPNGKQEVSKLIQEQDFTSRIGVVVDYGIIIPVDVIDSFEKGIINSHFSLLPQWRGADPITFSLLSGQKETGVSLMLIVPALDEGDLLLQRKVAIEDAETIDSLTEKLINLSNEMLVDTIPPYLDDMVHPYVQDETQHVSYSRMLTKQDGELDWNKSAEQLEREIRAYRGWPGSKTTIAGKRVTVLDAEVVDEETGEIGAIRAENKKILVQCGQGSLLINRLKPDGKAEMPAEAFLAGNPLS